MQRGQEQRFRLFLLYVLEWAWPQEAVPENRKVLVVHKRYSYSMNTYMCKWQTLQALSPRFMLIKSLSQQAMEVGLILGL